MPTCRRGRNPSPHSQNNTHQKIPAKETYISLICTPVVAEETLHTLLKIEHIKKDLYTSKETCKRDLRPWCVHTCRRERNSKPHFGLGSARSRAPPSLDSLGRTLYVHTYVYVCMYVYISTLISKCYIHSEIHSEVERSHMCVCLPGALSTGVETP